MAFEIPIPDEALLARDWYYSIEIAPGVWTPGKGHLNIIATRELLRRVAVAGASCLDFGTQEALVPILLARRGAAAVVALDIWDHTEKIVALKRVYGVRFDYCPGVSLDRSLQLLDDRRRLAQMKVAETWPRVGFDLVVMSGLLYHVHSPFHALGIARTALKPGGVLVLETAAALDDGYALRWAFDGTRWIYPGATDLWFPTLKLLDHALRLFHLAPLDCVHLPPHDGIVRVAVACRAVDAILARASEGNLMRRRALNPDYNLLFDRRWAADERSTIAYEAPPIVAHGETGTCDLHASVAARTPLTLDPRRACLGLDDRE